MSGELGELGRIRIAFVGGGHMGRALAGGLIARGVVASHIAVGEADPATRAGLARDLGLTAVADNAEAVRGAALVVLAVKPQSMREVLAGLAPELQRSGALILSIAAGIRVHDLQQWSGGNLAVVRAMPNRPALVGAGATALYAPGGVAGAARALAEAAMRAVGTVVWVAEEPLIDVVTALSGSGPAYFFLLGELMAEAGEQLGLDRATARSLAVATLAGAGALAAAGDGDLARMRVEVTSRGGTTEAALRTLGDADLRAIVLRALAAATARGRELAGEAAGPAPRIS